jgi:hypothetical protein
VGLEIGGQFTLPLLLIAGCCLHFILVAFILIANMVEQIKRKCNDRSEILKRMFKVEDQLKASSNKEK